MSLLNSPGSSGTVESISLSAENLSLDVSNIIADINTADLAGLFLSVDPDDALAVDISDGLANDGTDSIRVDGSSVADGVLAEGTSPHQLQLDFTNGLENNNDSLRISPDDIAGNALVEETATQLGVDSNSITSSEIDEGSSLTWTVSQTFNAGAVLGGSIDMQSNTITNLPAPGADSEVARKAYVDGVAAGLNLKDSCIAATDGTNIDLTSATDPNPIDGVTLQDGERVLLKDQTDGAENGIYVASTATDPTTWTRATDFDEDAEVTSGTFTFITEGTVNQGAGFVVITADPITVGTTAIQFAQFSSASDILAGDGILKSGSEISVSVADFAGLFISDDGSNNVQVDIGTGLENDGTDNIRPDGATIADGVLQQGSNPYQLNVNFGNGLENNTGVLRFNPVDVAGDGLEEASATTLAVTVPDFAGTFLSDDGSNNLTVDLGNGVSGDGGGNIRTNGSAIADGVLQAGANPHQLNVNIGNALENNSGKLRIDTSVLAGNGLNGTSGTEITVNIADFIGTFLQNDGSGNITLKLANSLENDGSGNIRVNEDFAFTFTSQIDFNSGLTLNTSKVFYSTSTSVRYDSGDDDIRWRDETNNAERMGLDRTTGDLDISGSFTEGAAL